MSLGISSLVLKKPCICQAKITLSDAGYVKTLPVSMLWMPRLSKSIFQEGFLRVLSALPLQSH